MLNICQIVMTPGATLISGEVGGGHLDSYNKLKTDQMKSSVVNVLARIVVPNYFSMSYGVSNYIIDDVSIISSCC